MRLPAGDNVGGHLGQGGAGPRGAADPPLRWWVTGQHGYGLRRREHPMRPRKRGTTSRLFCLAMMMAVLSIVPPAASALTGPQGTITGRTAPDPPVPLSDATSPVTDPVSNVLPSPTPSISEATDPISDAIGDATDAVSSATSSAAGTAA